MEERSWSSAMLIAISLILFFAGIACWIAEVSRDTVLILMIGSFYCSVTSSIIDGAKK